MNNIKNISSSKAVENWNLEGNVSYGADSRNSANHLTIKEQLENPFSTKKQKTVGKTDRKGDSLGSGSESTKNQPNTVKHFKTNKFDS